MLTGSDNQWGQPVLAIDDEVWLVWDALRIQGYIYEAILCAITSRIRSHILFHGAALVHEGRAIVLSGDTGHGKTTLTLRLMRRGFKFLSDEMAAFSRKNGLVHPFPRALRIRPNSLKLAGFIEVSRRSSATWLHKSIVDVDQILPGGMGEKAPLSYVILLTDPIDARPNADNDLAGMLQITVERIAGDLIAAIRTCSGVISVGVASMDGYPVVSVKAQNRMAVLDSIEELCRKRRILILDIKKRHDSRPAFDKSAALAPVTGSEAVIELLRRFQGTHRSRLVQAKYGGSSMKLFLDVADFVKDAQCYRLHVGALEEMADLICDLVGTNFIPVGHSTP